jgi:hypothetical protein
MEENKFIKVDDNRIINEKHIRWIIKMSDCLEVCTRSNGCAIDSGQTHKICKLNNLESYNKFNKLFTPLSNCNGYPAISIAEGVNE